MKTPQERQIRTVEEMREALRELGPIAPVGFVGLFLGCHRQTVYRWVDEGRLPVCRLQGSLWVPVRRPEEKPPSVWDFV